MLKKFFILLFIFSGSIANAQGAAPEMADKFRQDGKIYVVITVLSIVFVCIIGILLIIERRLKRLEKEVNETKN